jgi:hypothetical protein
VRKGDWKLVWDQAAPEAGRRWMLFNLAEDPLEQNDVSAAHPDKLAELTGIWNRYQERNGVIY